MKAPLFTIIIILLLAILLFEANRVVLSKKSFSWKTGINFIASACLIIGSLGFLGSAISAMGGLSWVPFIFEWPIGQAEKVAVASDGSFIVPHIPSGRIQIYNRKLEFQRGWFVDSGGGAFELFLGENDEVFVYTPKGSIKYQYDIYGKMISSKKYEYNITSPLNDKNINIKIPTPFYLVIFSHPFFSWSVAAAGMVLFFLLSIIDKIQLILKKIKAYKI